MPDQSQGAGWPPPFDNPDFINQLLDLGYTWGDIGNFEQSLVDNGWVNIPDSKLGSYFLADDTIDFSPPFDDPSFLQYLLGLGYTYDQFLDLERTFEINGWIDIPGIPDVYIDPTGLFDPSGYNPPGKGGTSGGVNFQTFTGHGFPNVRPPLPPPGFDQTPTFFYPYQYKHQLPSRDYFKTVDEDQIRRAKEKLRKQTEDKKLCNSLPRFEFGSLDIEHCTDDLMPGDMRDVLNVKTPAQWGAWINEQKISPTTDAINKLTFGIGDKIEQLLKHFGDLGEDIKIVLDARAALNEAHAYDLESDPCWIMVSTTFSGFKQFQDLIWKYRDVFRVLCQKQLAKQYLNDHNLDHFPCPEDQKYFDQLDVELKNKITNVTNDFLNVCVREGHGKIK